MNTPFIPSRLVLALIAGLILAVPTLNQAGEPYQRVTVDELKRIQKQNDEEQRRLEATPEYQAKKRQEEADQKRREHDAFVAKQNELRLQTEAAKLEHQRLENKNLSSGNSTSQSTTVYTNGVAWVPNALRVPRLAVVPTHTPSSWFPGLHVTHRPVVKHVPAVRIAKRIHR